MLSFLMEVVNNLLPTNESSLGDETDLLELIIAPCLSKLKLEMLEISEEMLYSGDSDE